MNAASIGLNQKLNLPSPYDAQLNRGLERNSQRLAGTQAPHVQAQQEILSPPTPQPRPGSTQAIIKQREVLQQDVFQRQNIQQSETQRITQELPQRSPSFIDQVAQTTRQFLSQLERLNQSDLVRRQAQGTQLQITEGRHQVHHQNATLYMRLKEPSFVTKSKREEDIVRRKQRQQRTRVNGKYSESTQHFEHEEDEQDANAFLQEKS